MYTRIAIPLFCAAALLSEPVAAQTPESPSPPPSVPVPLAYESPYAGYVRYRDEAIAPWREINTEVAHIGGHKGAVSATVHEAFGSARPADAKPATTAPPAPGHDRGHY